MTKSLGRTYFLLDFSRREMHYWPGNLPRRRDGVASPGTLYVRCYRALHPLVSCFKRTQRAAPRRLFLFSLFALLGSRVVALTIASFWKGRSGSLSHVRKVITRLLFLQTAMSDTN